MSSLIVFDDGKGQLAPLTDLRAAFDIRTGAYTTLERIEAEWTRITGLVVPPHLAAITRERHNLPVNEDIVPGDDDNVLLSGRCPQWRDTELPATGLGLFEHGSGDLHAARLNRADALRFIRGEPVTIGRHPEAFHDVLISRPWHVRSWRDLLIADDLRSHRDRAIAPDQIPSGVAVVGTRGLEIRSTARVYPGVVLDCQPGPIVVDDHAVVRPGAVIIGPVYIGPHSAVLDRAVIRSNTVIGPHCKVAGEVSGTIFQGYANKAHDGFLGDSYVGEWANLGAGTTNSNLLNTYGEVPVRSQPGGPMERTGETFMGCIIGDHAKFAICTRIMTGAVIHTGAMYAATAPAAGCIPPFAWITDEGRRTYRLDKFTDVARTVMARRKITPSDAYLARLAELHGAAAGT